MTAVRRTRAVELFWAAHRWLYRASGGRIGAKLGTLSVLMLTTQGRTTSAQRTVVLIHMSPTPSGTSHSHGSRRSAASRS